MLRVWNLTEKTTTKKLYVLSHCYYFFDFVYVTTFAKLYNMQVMSLAAWVCKRKQTHYSFKSIVSRILYWVEDDERGRKKETGIIFVFLLFVFVTKQFSLLVVQKTIVSVHKSNRRNLMTHVECFYIYIYFFIFSISVWIYLIVIFLGRLV